MLLPGTSDDMEQIMVKKASQATPNSRLRAARLQRGWSQRQVADQIGAPHTVNVSRWESGTAFPSAYYIERLCLLFGKSASELGLSQLEGHVQEENSLPTAPPQQQAPAPHGQLNSAGVQPSSPLWTLPFPRNPFFLGREEILAHLSRQFQESQMPPRTQALSGLGGVGKTQVALEYAYRSARNYHMVFWMRADTRDALIAGFLEIASVIQLPEHSEQDQRIILAAVKNWLCHHTNWLLILDNADDLALLTEFLPSPLSGHLLLTTRAQALGPLANRIELETLDLESAALLLLRRAGVLALDASLAQAESDDWKAAVQLAQELGCLPLALAQAGSYLEETRCGFQQYLQLYQSHRADLLRHRGGVAPDHPEAVATTWLLSFTFIEQRSPVAAELLRLCAVLYPDTIPEVLFQRAAPHLGPVLSMIEANPLALNQALAVIQSSSLLRRNSRQHTLSIHRLVQAVLVDTMTTQERELWRRRAIAGLNTVFPDMMPQGWEQWETCECLLPHVLKLATTLTRQTESLEMASLLTKTAHYLSQRAQYAEAEPLYQRSVSLYEQMLERDDPQIAFPFYGLAGLYREQGRYSQAEPLYLQALHLWEQAAPQGSPEIATVLNDLAILYLEQGNVGQAEPLLLRALHLNEHLFGPEHREIAACLNNLAGIFVEQGNVEQAESFLLRAVRLKQLFGETHPEVAFPLTNLADLYRDQGRYAEAEPLYQRALQIREQSLGTVHPQVAFPLGGLANLYRDQGRYAEAEPLYQRALQIREQQRGAEHLETAESLDDFARFYELQNQPEVALKLYRRVLLIREHALGSQHPRTLQTRSRCAHLFRILGQTEQITGREISPN